MALTRQQFQQLLDSGLTAEDIAKFDSTKSEGAITTPDVSRGTDAGQISELTPWQDVRARIAQGLSMAPSVLGGAGAIAGGIAGAGGGLTLASPTGPGAAVAAGIGGVTGAARGATVGGTAGKAIELAGDRALGYQTPDLPTAAAQSLAAGGEQGLYTVGGEKLAEGAAPLLKATAKPLYNFALKLTKTIRKNFGDIGAEMMARGTPVTKQAGQEARVEGERMQGIVGHHVQRVKDVVDSEWSRATNDVQMLLKDADEQGGQISVDQIAQPLLQVAKKNAERAGRQFTQADREQVIHMVTREANDLLGQGTFDLSIIPSRAAFTPSETHAITQAAQNESRGFYRARAMGQTVKSSPERTASLATGGRAALIGEVPGYETAQGKLQHAVLLKRALAKGPNSKEWDMIVHSGDPVLEDLTRHAQTSQQLERAVESGRRNAPLHPYDWPQPTGDPKLDQLINESRTSVGIERALMDASSRQEPTLLPAMVGGAAYAGAHDPVGALITGLVTRAALSPGNTSRLALLLNNPATADAVATAARQGPRAVQALIEQLTYQEPQLQEGDR